ncbi:MAG: hypothetical protein AABZ47_16980 [Planctomycetota bacterium]
MVSDPGTTSKIIAVVQDLIFATKIRSTAASGGISLDLVRTASDLSAALDREPVCAVIVDLNLPGVEAVQAIVQAHAHPRQPRIVAFGSHVDVPALNLASQTGAHEVMPRSRFSIVLPDLLQQLAGNAPR